MRNPTPIMVHPDYGPPGLSDTDPMNATAASSPAPATLPDWAVELKGLTKTYSASGKAAPKHALKGIDLNIPRGSFFGLLGPNGAGKSTMINILAGLVIKSSGAARIWGRTPAVPNRCGQ